MSTKYKSVEEIKEIIDNYNELKEYCEKYVENEWNSGVIDVDYENGNIRIDYDYVCCGQDDCGTKIFPIEWLLFSYEEYIKAKKEKEQKDKEEVIKRKEAEKKAEEEKKLQEERAEYERLKAKFEK